MINAIIHQGQSLLSQAAELRDTVRANLSAGRYGNDDVLMKAYNDLCQSALTLFPDDPVLGALVVMPDAVLQSFGTLFPVASMRPDMASQRLDAHLTRLINQLGFVLANQPISIGQSAKTAAEVLDDERTGEVQTILDELERLTRSRRALGAVDERDFDFVSDSALRQVLAADFVEAQRAFAVAAFKASALLSGGLIEGMLLDALRRPGIEARDNYRSAVMEFPKLGQGINWDKVSLSHLLEAGVELGFLPVMHKGLVEGARDFRDTVHPNAEVRLGLRARREEAELLLAIVKLLYRHMSEVS